MFSYWLSVAVAFILFGTVFNVIKKIDPTWYNYDFDDMGWGLVVVAAILWFIAVPIICVVVLLYLFKLLTDGIANVILNTIEKRKFKSGEKDVK